MSNQQQWLPLFVILVLNMNLFPRAASQYSVFKCTTVGYFADPLDCHSFYSCDSSLNPTHSTCTSLGHFDTKQVCVVGACPTDVTTTATVIKTGQNCESKGYFLDPLDCHSYYSCDNNLVATHSTCTIFGYFDAPSQSCKIGACTTTAQATSTPASPTKAAVQVSSTPAQFQCTSSGYFADPNDCKRFYTCGPSLVATSGICMGGGGHFDKNSLGCVMGPC